MVSTIICLVCVLFVYEVPQYDDSEESFDEDGLPVSSRPKESAPPPPPPPMPPVAPPMPNNAHIPSKPKKDKSNMSKAPSCQDLVQEELKHVLTMFKERRRDIDILKTPQVFIDQNSNPMEVQHWLEAKGFSQRLCKQLKGMTGHELFSLNRDQLEKHCGNNEGHRLYSQLTIQKNVSGYKTARSSELKAILDKARQKIDGKIEDMTDDLVSSS